MRQQARVCLVPSPEGCSWKGGPLQQRTQGKESKRLTPFYRGTVEASMNIACMSRLHLSRVEALAVAELICLAPDIDV